MQDQSILTLPNYPWACKIVVAAFFDAFFIKNIGKCKTYILICGICKCGIQYYLSFTITDYVDNLEIMPIAISYFVLNVFSALESISVDAWCLTLLDEEEDLPKGALAMFVGQILGAFVTFNTFGILGSTQFLNDFFFQSNPRKAPLVTLQASHQFVAWFSLISMVVIMLTVSEKHIKKANFCGVFKLIPKFFTNGGIMSFTMFLMIKYFGLNLFNSVATFYQIEKGYSYDYIIITATAMIPVSQIVSIIGSKWLVRGLNQKNSIIASFVQLLNGIVTFWLTWNYKGAADNWSISISLIITNTLLSIGILSTIYDSGFQNDIADHGIGGSYITFIACFMNLSGYLPETLGLWIFKYTTFEVFSIVSQAIAALTLPLNWYWAINLDNKDVLEFKLCTEGLEVEENEKHSTDSSIQSKKNIIDQQTGQGDGEHEI